MKRKWTALLLCAAMLLGLIGGCSPKSGGEPDSPAYITRGQWVTLLAQTFGMDQYAVTTPLFSDVSADSALFPYAQASAEWGVLDFSKDVLDPDQTATREFVAKTAVLATTLDYKTTVPLGIVEGEDDLILSFAYENGIVSGGGKDRGVTQGMTMPECQSAAAIAKDLYLNRPFEPYENVEVRDDVTDLTHLPSTGYDISGTAATVDSEYADEVAELQVGDVIITDPTPEEPWGVARKITALSYDENGNAVYETIEPELSDIYDELEFAADVVPTLDQFTPAPGVTVTAGGAGTTGFSGAPTPVLLGSGGRGHQVAPLGSGLSFSLSVGLKYGQPIDSAAGSPIEISAAESGADLAEANKALDGSGYRVDPAPSEADFPEGQETWSRPLEEESAWEGGYEVTGTLTISDLYIRPDVSINPLPLKINRLAVDTNFAVSSSISVGGTLSNDISLGTFTVPTSVLGVAVKLELFLYVDLDGKIQVKFELANHTRVEYAGGGFRKTSDQTNTVSYEAAVTLDTGLKPSATLTCFGLGIADVNVQAGICLDAKASLSGAMTLSETEKKYQETLTVSLDLYGPILAIEVGGADTLIQKLKLSATFTILGAENTGHFPIYKKDFVIWELVKPLDGTERPQPSAGEGDQDSEGDPFSMLSIQDTVLTLGVGDAGQVVITGLPDGTTMSDVRFESKNSAIATVDANGNVTAVEEGNAQIYVTTSKGGLAVCAVMVRGDKTFTSDDFL